jgi:hypothetical protein
VTQQQNLTVTTMQRQRAACVTVTSYIAHALTPNDAHGDRPTDRVDRAAVVYKQVRTVDTATETMCSRELQGARSSG